MAVATKMSSTMVRQQIVRLFEAINERDIPKMLEFFTDDVVWSQPFGEPVVGRAEADRLLHEMYAMMPDLRFDLDTDNLLVSQDGTHAASVWRLTGTMTGVAKPFDYQPTGRSATVQGACVYQFQDGRIARHTILYDGLDLMQQLGLLPAMDSLPTKVLAAAHNVTTRLSHALHR